MASAGEILTVGHSNHEEGEFIELLRGAGVELIADVRANPRSALPALQPLRPRRRSLQAAGIGYARLGAELGGRREPLPDSPNGAWETSPFRGYADHMASDEFAAGLAELEQLARERRVAMMCAEADWAPLPPPPDRRRAHGPRLARPPPRPRRRARRARADDSPSSTSDGSSPTRSCQTSLDV